jgi:membrane protease YdiL (CAAX protease family)
MTRKPVALYLILVVAFSAPFWTLILTAGSLELARGFVIHSLMWAPALAALTASWLLDRSLSRIGWHWGTGRYELAGYLIPIGYTALAYVPLWIGGLAPLSMATFAATSAKGLAMTTGSPVFPTVIQIVLTLGFGVVQSAASAAGEEIGWRGYLVPALMRRMGFNATVLVSGLIWAAWHMPVVLFADYNSAAPRGYAVACFTVMIVSSGAIAAWLRMRSASVWPAIVFHATHNAVVQWIFDPMTDSTGKAAWFAGEFGIALALSTALVAYVLISGRWTGRPDATTSRPSHPGPDTAIRPDR